MGREYVMGVTLRAMPNLGQQQANLLAINLLDYNLSTYSFFILLLSLWLLSVMSFSLVQA